MPPEEFDVTSGIQIGVEEFELGKPNVLSSMSLLSKLVVRTFLPDPKPIDV
jgi:hypothetical protein